MSDQRHVPRLTGWELGRLGEEYIAGKLVLMGAVVEASGPADLLVNDVPLEVKTGRFRHYKRGRAGYQFCLHRQGKPGLQAPYVALICWDWPPVDLPVFIIPTAEFNGHRKVTIPSPAADYAGRLSKWLGQWELLV